MNRRVTYFLAVPLIIVVLFISAYLTNIPWLWIIAVGTLAITMMLSMRHFANTILEENNQGEKQGRMFFLPRPSGLGSQAVNPVLGAGSNSLIVSQEKRSDEQSGEMHAYLAETAWASASDKEDEKKEP